MTMSVLIPSILQILNRIRQKLFFLFPLKQRSRDYHVTDFNLFLGNPLFCNWFSGVLLPKSNFCLLISLVVSDKGDVPALLVDVNIKQFLQLLFDILPSNFTTQSGQFQSSSLWQCEFIFFVFHILFPFSLLHFILHLLSAVSLLLNLLTFVLKINFLELFNEWLPILVFDFLKVDQLLRMSHIFECNHHRTLKMPFFSLFVEVHAHMHI